MQWTRNPVTEDLLNRLGIPFRYEEALPYKQLNIKESLRNNARPEKPIVEEAALSYGMAMEAGATFPAIVVSKNCKGYDILDGNNRMFGFDAAGLSDPDATVGAYVLQTDNALQIGVATRAFNRTNGVQQTREEALVHALNLLDEYPHLTQGEVAKAFGIQQTALSQAIRARAVADLLRERKLVPERLSRAMLCELAKLSHSEPAMALAADIAIGYELTVAEIKDIVTACKGKNSDERRMAYLRSVDDELASKSGKAIGSSGDRVKAGLRRCMTNLLNHVSKHPTLEHLHLTSKSEVEECRQVWTQVRDKMDAVFA